MNYPILMADTIDSGIQDSNELMHQLKMLVKSMNKQKQSLISPLTITLGDEFQGVCSSIPNAILMIISIEEMIIKNQYNIKLRYVLNFGKIDTKINSVRAYEMLGVGLTEARKKLNSLKTDDARFCISIGRNRKKSEEILNDAFFILQSFIDSWNVKDYELVAAFLTNSDYKKVAEKVQLDKSSAWRRRKSLKIQEYNRAKNIILAVLKSMK